MAAEIGNKYAEKWNKETTLAKLAELEKSVKTTVYIGEGLGKIGLYNQWFSEMAEKFNEDDEVSETIKRIEQQYEAKLVAKTLKGELNPTMAIFTLKNKHKWKDASQVDQNVNVMNWHEEKTYEAKPKTDEGA